MAKLAVTFVLLCLFFAFSHARFASDLPQIEAFAKEATEILPEADSKPSTTGDILLPSEKHVSEPGSETIQVNLEESVSEPGADDAAPLTLISFRPVNRHFPRRPFPLTLRHGHRCRHHFMKQWGQRRPHGDIIPYGNDMILSTEDRPSFDPVLRSGFPARWIKIRHMEAESAHRRGDKIYWPHHDEEHEHDHHHHEEHEHDHKHERQNVFLKSFRKFMKQF
ncbi:hypothetical protein L484_000045 [Morus notabilis]|uniref:Uncharacterized protein n=1 Tax=Morus notabilis TaxID=981085 RepID=W9SFL4_9ROSA|nr:hypothetical protein L484_000045 [Morus notabilis]